MMRITTAIATATAILLPGSALAAQATASHGHTALQNEASDGRRTQSTTYVLDGAVGVGATARRTTSGAYVLEGGFASTLNVPNTGRPWLTAVTPRTAAMRSQATLTLKGTELDVGSMPTVKIGGVPAPVLSRSKEAISTAMPVQFEPGWLTVEVSNSHGTTVLPRGVGVLPIVETDPAPASERDFDLVLRGTKGDQVIWALGLGQGRPLIVTGLHFGFALGPPPFIILGGFQITTDDGVLRLPVGGEKYPQGLVFIQALFLSQNPGYAPGAFSNVLRI